MMKMEVLLLALLGLSHVKFSVGQTGGNRTLGQPSLDDYMVRLTNKDGIFCTGVIVNRRQVLTAWNCNMRSYGKSIKALLSDGSTYSIEHETWANDYTAKDVPELILLELKPELGEQFSQAPPFCKERPGSSEILDLWKWDSSGRKLEKKPTPQTPAKDCGRHMYRLDGRLNWDEIVCLNTSPASKEHCLAIRGSPFVWRNTFCGMNAKGSCSTLDLPGLFVPLLKVD